MYGFVFATFLSGLYFSYLSFSDPCLFEAMLEGLNGGKRGSSFHCRLDRDTFGHVIFVICPEARFFSLLLNVLFLISVFVCCSCYCGSWSFCRLVLLLILFLKTRCSGKHVLHGSRVTVRKRANVSERKLKRRVLSPGW